MVHLIPINTTTMASELALLYIREIIRLHGLPHSIVSDRDSKFTSKFWKETHQLLGTKLLMSTAFHPQMDGATEQANHLVGQILQSVIQPNQSDWVDKLPIVEFAINSNISSSMGFAPFELNYGYLPTLIGGITPTENTKPGVHKFINQAINNLEDAHDAIQKTTLSLAYKFSSAPQKERPCLLSTLAHLQNLFDGAKQELNVCTKLKSKVNKKEFNVILVDHKEKNHTKKSMDPNKVSFMLFSVLSDC